MTSTVDTITVEQAIDMVGTVSIEQTLTPAVLDIARALERVAQAVERVALERVAQAVERVAPESGVTIPRHVLVRALTKARTIYVAVAAEHGRDPGPDDECWAEFERLADYVGTTDELIADESRP